MAAPHLAPFTEASSLVFLSGQLPFDATGRISSTDIGGQTAQVLGNIAAVLEQAGLTLADIVKTTVWLRSATDFAAFNDSYAACFGTHRPARSTVVSELVLPGALIEIEAVAQRPA
jgi:2-iminobutanoate/2-iminopropanoate deaminase